MVDKPCEYATMTCPDWIGGCYAKRCKHLGIAFYRAKKEYEREIRFHNNLQKIIKEKAVKVLNDLSPEDFMKASM